MASSKETYCLCGQPYNIGQFMIECDCCREWFHGSCVDVKVYHSDDIDKYHCPKCAQTYGPSVLKIPTNNHRADRYELSAETRPSQVGTPAWVRALAARPLRPVATALQRMRPQEFTEEFIRDNGFTRPVVFTSTEGLDIKIPNPATFTARSVLRYCGAQFEVEVIDVRKQGTLRMPLGDFVDYFETPPDLRMEKVLNVLSLEFSDTNMSTLVSPPGIARKLDWAECVWPSTAAGGGGEAPRPRPAVQKYCLMSAGGSYTDFHVDFGGTTVWYHVMRGRKIFYLIPPTATNLALYQQWTASNNQNERFFGDMVEWYGTAEITSGCTLMIPGGWIHAVLTPVDSLVLGGNLLHSYAIEMQLQIYEIERRVETPHAFRYPLFEAMHWYAGAALLTLLRRHNEETQDEDFTISEYSVSPVQQQLPPLLLRGIKILANALKEWHALKTSDSAKRDNVPKCLNSGQLVRELAKELRTIEKRTHQPANNHKELKPKNSSPKKGGKAQQQQKKSLKLTLPKPIMHMGQNGEYPEEKMYADKFYIDNKEVVYQDNRYLPEAKYIPSLSENKELVYQSYEQPPTYTDQPYVERHEKKNILRIKLHNSPMPLPPPYAAPPSPEHSILKSQLVGNHDRPTHTPWTISKKDIGEYQEEQILFTNDNLQTSHDISYGPGMYSAEDIQQPYTYSSVVKPGATFQPEYSYHQQATHQTHPELPLDNYHRLDMQTVQTPAYSTVPAPVTEPVNNGSFSNQLPSYDAAIAQQYATTNYVVDTPSPAPTPPGVRRSERPVRRRVSNTYDYEDADLYIDDTPAPRRRHKTKHKPVYKHAASSSSNYLPEPRPAPANGIESLIQASVLAEDQPPTDTEDAAVAGMLSISEQRYPPAPRTFGLPAHTPSPSTQDSTTEGSSSSSRRVRKPVVDDELSDEEDVIREVHRDEEYVYPSLEMSSDEDEEWTASRRRNSRSRHDSRGKADKDESWSPRARLGRLVPRLRTTARSNVRRECVRAALTAAAARPAPRPAPRPARVRPPPHPPRAVKRPPVEKTRPQSNNASKQNTRLKKGMKTAKQRLGKILKIHKMIY